MERSSSEQIEAQLARILATDVFRRSSSLSRFLKYLVDRAIAGHTEGVKEFQLGVEVFDRGEDFDPRMDTIVRVQARNLRARLEEYYSGGSPDDTVRFVLPKGAYAVQVEPLHAETAPPAPAPKRLALWPVAMAVVVAIAAIGSLWIFRRQPAVPANPSLLVAPLTNLSSDPDNEYFAGGLTEELIDALSHLPGLRVLARSASLRFKDANLRDTGVTHVIEGGVRKTGGKVRISIRLIETRKGETIWSHEYDRDVQDAIATEQEIARAVAAALKLQLASTRPPKVADPDAYENYLKGLYYWHQTDAASAAKGIAYLERSISIDPSFAPAYVALAGCYGSQAIFSAISFADAYAKTRELALKALQIDDSIADAHTLLAGTYAWNDWNWNRAELEYRGGAQLGPQNVIAHQYYASFLGSLGRQKEAEAQMQIALALDPLDSLLLWGEAQLMYWRADYRAAEALLSKIQAQDPAFGLTIRLLAEVDWALGKDPEQALRGWLRTHPSDPIPLGQLGFTLAKSGRAAEARQILAQLREIERRSVVPGHAIAFVYQGLGENDHAIDELWKACENRTLRASWLKVDPAYRPLRSGPRFAELLRHIHLEP